MDDLTEDHLLGGRVRLLQPRQGFRAAIDPVLLAAFVPARAGERVAEAGCGSGAAFLCLAARVPGLEVVAIERDPALAALARRNAELNGVTATIHAGDLRAAPDLGSIDHAFANPPYWPGGTPSPQGERRQAAHEDMPLVEWVRAIAAPLRRRGSLSLVLPAGRWSEAAGAMRRAGLGALRLLPIQPRPCTAARRILLQGRLSARSPDEVLPPLVLHAGHAGFLPEAEAVLRDATGLGLPPAKPGRPRAPSQAMRALILLPILTLAGCADPGGISFRGTPLSLNPARLTDGAYSAGARAGERLGITPPGDTPSAGEWQPRDPEVPARKRR